jgi:hypothetical protein
LPVLEIFSIAGFFMPSASPAYFLQLETDKAYCQITIQEEQIEQLENIHSSREQLTELFFMIEYTTVFQPS